MELPKRKHAWMVKIGEKGQFVIPKEARELFGFQPGQTILVLADEDKGIAIPSRADSAWPERFYFFLCTGFLRQ